MARLCYDLDGSRAFHRTSPWGGSIHNYDTYWGMQDIDVALQLKAPFLGEFGMASAPNLESVRRYLPREEWDEWDVTAKNSFNYHTPRFNECQEIPDMNHLLKRVPEFYDADTMEHFIVATQLAQATCIRHTLESFRSRWPEATGICYYKMTDVYPACSWSTVDYYGAPKRSYYVLADSYAPLHACVTTESTTLTPGGALPVFLLNDTAAPGNYRVTIAAYDAALKPLLRRGFETNGGETVNRLGDFAPEIPDAGPVFLTAEVCRDGAFVDRTFYWFNYKDQAGCLFDRAPHGAALRRRGGDAYRRQRGDAARRRRDGGMPGARYRLHHGGQPLLAGAGGEPDACRQPHGGDSGYPPGMRTRYTHNESEGMASVWKRNRCLHRRGKRRFSRCWKPSRRCWYPSCAGSSPSPRRPSATI